MSDDEFLESFSSFLMELRTGHVPDHIRRRALKQVQETLDTIVRRLGDGPDRQGQQPGVKRRGSDPIGHALEKIGRAIFTKHPYRKKMKDIFELLDVDHDGLVLIGMRLPSTLTKPFPG